VAPQPRAAFVLRVKAANPRPTTEAKCGPQTSSIGSLTPPIADFFNNIDPLRNFI